VLQFGHNVEVVEFSWNPQLL